MSLAEPEFTPASPAEWDQLFPNSSTNDLLTVFKFSVRTWVSWGAANAATGLTSDQRQKILDAIVLLETGAYRGAEPTTAFPGFEREVRFAQARRAQLARLSDADLGEQCRILLEEEAARYENFSAFLNQQRSERSQAARDLVSKRYWYQRALEEYARQCRGKGWSARRAVMALTMRARRLSDGTRLTARDDRIVIDHPVRGRRDIAAEQFRRFYWPRAK